MIKGVLLIATNFLKTIIEKFINLRKYFFNKPINARKTYFEILDCLDKNFPGRGIDVFDTKIKDRPMAYGILLSAEANRFRHTGELDALEFIRKCGDWLIENADLNRNGIFGYGLADPMDAFSDGYINPAHHEYTITTSFAVAGLLDWYQLEPDSDRKTTIYCTVRECLTPYLDGSWDSPLGIPSYSLNENDKKYDVYNPAAMLAAQLQRFSQITDEVLIKRSMSMKANKIISIILENALFDLKGNRYWKYGIQFQKPNDLVHAAYIVEGFRDYHLNEGSVALDLHSIMNHLLLFMSGKVWYEHIDKSRQNSKRNARLWALGMLLYSLARDKRFDLIDATLLTQLAVYKKNDGHFMLKTNDDRVLIRHEAHLMLGLSFYLFRS